MLRRKTHDSPLLARKKRRRSHVESPGSLLLHSGKRNSKLTSIPSFKKVELYTKLPSCCLHFSQKDIRQRVSRMPQDAHPDDLWNRLLEQLDPFPAESFSDSERSSREVTPRPSQTLDQSIP